ncbi:MAG: hypothetical protein IT460_15485 [Planctomycetes bacterium]|nr:hypothetical protein [Planctomycetota bacterium]
MRRIQTLLLATVLGATAGPAVAGDEGPPSSEAWVSKDGPPPWTDGAGDGVVRGVVASQSNQLSLAVPHSDEWVLTSVRGALAWRLRGVLGDGADVLLELPFAAAPTLRRAFHKTPPAVGDRSLGAQAALERAEPADAPAWTAMSEPPEWAERAGVARETWVFALEVSAEREDVAKAQATTLAAERVAWSIADPLRRTLGADVAWDVGRRAASWRRATARGTARSEGRPTTWTRFEVPVARILAAVPEEKRDAARDALSPKPRAMPDGDLPPPPGR